MNCRECAELLYDYLDNELNSMTCRDVENHLASCGACRAQLEEIKASLALYRHHIAAVELDEAFTGRVLASLPEPARAMALSRFLVVLGAALLALLVIGMALVLPVIYPVLAIAAELLVNLLPIPAIILAAFPAVKLSSLTVLAFTLIVMTWATRRVILS